MAHYKIFGRDPYWMNFYGLMILTLIEVAAVGLDLTNLLRIVGLQKSCHPLDSDNNCNSKIHHDCSYFHAPLRRC